MKPLAIVCGVAAVLFVFVALPTLEGRAASRPELAGPAAPAPNPVFDGVVVGEPGAKTVAEEDDSQLFVPVTQTGMGWLNSPPPTDVQTAGLKSKDGATFVGIVYPPATKPDDQVTSTMVAMTMPGTDPSVLEGMVLVDPTGKKHTVKNGELIAFTAVAVGVWKLIEGSGKEVASCNVELNKKVAELYGAAPMEDPIVCKPGSVIDVPGKFDGTVGNTKVSNARVLAENPRSCVMAINDNAPIGKNDIEISDGDYSAKVPCHFVSINVTGPREMRLGEAGLMKIRVAGLGGMSARHQESIGKMLAVRYRNSTPNVVSFGSEEGGFKMVTVKDGTFEMDVPFQSIAAGRYQIHAWTTKPPLGGTGVYCQGFQCCTTACAPCSSSWGFCDDRGRTNCTRIGGRTGTHCVACMGGVCNHIGSSACGHWWCACPFGFCAC